uniref:6-pyruvoyl tetrahydrobiopterin synthase n=1 Tax=Acrobeloides nanus TaxID=290746 RepID=A0A914C6J4_9BILA
MPAPNLARPIVQLKRVETFSAAHRLHSTELSDEENLQIFGKCNNPNSHGHNYTWEAVLKGPVDPRTGMVYNLADLKKEMAVVLEMVDHKNLDKDVAYFRDNNIISTTENLAVFLYTELKNRMRSPELLYEVTVRETDKNIFTFSGSFS